MRSFLSTFLLTIGLLCPVVLASANNQGDGGVIDIIITEGGNEGGMPGYYAPILIPIEAAYYPSMSTIMVNFLYPLGIVSVEIENQTTGTYAQTNVNASQGVHPFLISGTVGHWTITFTLSNGKVYFGEFDIYS